ncbi:MAG: lysophospholipid acyltransferase family protein [Mycobacteriales bacterium]
MAALRWVRGVSTSGGFVRRGFWLRLTEVLVRPIAIMMTKRQWRGQEHIPASGPAILVPNHLSNADPLIVAHFVFDRPRNPRFLAKDSLFTVPVIGYMLRQMHQIPVRRGTADAMTALKAAISVLESDETVIIYPEGTCTADPQLWPMQGKTGVARLALTTGASVIPIAQWGAQRFHNPVTGKIGFRPRTRVTVAAGPPVDLTRFMDCPLTNEVLRGATDTILRRLRDDVAAVRGEPAPVGPLFVPAKSRRLI